MPFCNRCGQEYQLGQAFCSKCGSKLLGTEPVPEEPQSRAPATPKVRRFVAGVIDVSVVLAIIGALFLSRRLALAMLIRRRIAWFVPSAYFLLKDSIAGKSIGKLFTGVLVLNEGEKKPAGPLDSIIRNWPLAIPIVGWLLILVIGAQILAGKRQRMGDAGANTIVISDGDYQGMR